MRFLSIYNEWLSSFSYRRSTIFTAASICEKKGNLPGQHMHTWFIWYGMCPCIQCFWAVRLVGWLVNLKLIDPEKNHWAKLIGVHDGDALWPTCLQCILAICVCNILRNNQHFLRNTSRTLSIVGDGANQEHAQIFRIQLYIQIPRLFGLHVKWSHCKNQLWYYCQWCRFSKSKYEHFYNKLKYFPLIIIQFVCQKLWQ